MDAWAERVHPSYPDHMANRFEIKKVVKNGIPTKIDGIGIVAQWSLFLVNRDWFWGLTLVLLIILTYSPVWHAGFVWDDDILLTANPVITGPLGLKEIWTTSAVDICPLTVTMFWVEHAVWDFTPLPYHLVNVLLHGASAVLLWRVLFSLNVPGAWMGAALWALHPVMVESVAPICEMKNTQSGFFFLLSILFFLRWLKARSHNEQTGDHCNYTMTLIFAALSMASKSSTVTLPIVLCLSAWWMEGGWHWRNLTRMVPIFLMSVVASASTIWAQGLLLATDPQSVRTWPERLVTAGDAICFYLGKVFWPHPLILMYPRWEINSVEWVSYLPLLSMIIVFLVLWFNRRLWARAYFFALTYFLVSLLPVIGLIDQVWFWNSFVADHLQYLASMGPLALVGTGIIEFTKPLLPKKPWLQSSACAGVLLILGVLSWQRVWAYEDRDTLWKDTVAKNPNFWPAYNHLGFDFLQKGEVNEAISLFQKALKINPNYAKAHNNLGIALAQTGQMDPAIEHFQKAIEINPEFVEAHSNLGLALFHKSQIDDAIDQYQKALKINPNNAGVHVNLGNAFLKKGQVEEAMAQFQEALRLKPNFNTAQNSLTEIQAMVRQRQGQK
jgi:tetratricopeptide (TPR) repeat protein